MEATIPNTVLASPVHPAWKRNAKYVHERWNDNSTPATKEKRHNDNIHVKINNKYDIVYLAFEQRDEYPAMNTIQPISKRAYRGMARFLAVLSNALAIMSR